MTEDFLSFTCFGLTLWFFYCLLIKWPRDEKERTLRNQLEIERRQVEHLARQEEESPDEHNIRFLLKRFPWFFRYSDNEIEFFYRNLGKTGIIGECPDFGGLAAPNPAGMPHKLRCQHLAVFGKTGSGKSTFLEHMIEHDYSRPVPLIVISPEHDFFDRLLSFAPSWRRDTTIYFAPGDRENTIRFNPLTPSSREIDREADEVYSILGKLFGKDELGVRGKPILQNALSCVLSCDNPTFLDLKSFLEDPQFRAETLAQAPPHARSFFETTFRSFPKNSTLPLVHRLDRFLRSEKLRNTILQPSSFSISEVLERDLTLFIDLSRLTELESEILGGLFLAKLQAEIFRRESGADADPCFVYVDEFHAFAQSQLWRSLLSRGRKYGMSLTLSSQSPAQLPTSLQTEVFSNVSSLASFVLSESDASRIRKELLTERDGKVEPIPASDILRQKTGEAIFRLAGGLAFRAKLDSPIESKVEARDVALHSRRVYGRELEELPERFARAPVEPEMPSETREDAPNTSDPSRVEETAERGERAPRVESEQISRAAESKPKPEIEIPPRKPGRGGEEHKYLQHLLKNFAQKQGYKADIEYALEAGGFVDVLLSREEERIALEIAITSSVEQELGNVVKCLEAGIERVVVLTERKRFSNSLRKKLEGRAEVMTPDEFLAGLRGVETEEKIVAGYKVRVKYSDRQVDQDNLAKILVDSYRKERMERMKDEQS